MLSTCLTNFCNAGSAGHVLAHVINADVHQFDRIQRTAAEVLTVGYMVGHTAEVIVNSLQTRGNSFYYYPAESIGVPAVCDVYITNIPTRAP
ncbi:MAG: hypothetical protein GPOALKHO_001916 [Sodalis sp.]|nr:MAG: hypothetical protein GPOALKHO_001916 [Sodalis sp.]